MFSIFVYLFAAIVALKGSWHFFRAWQKNSNAHYGEFSAFLFTLGIGYVLFAFAGLTHNPISLSLGAEALVFCILFSFAFISPVFIQFQQIRAISVYFLGAVIGMIAVVRFIMVRLYFPSAPVIKDNLIYWNYPMVNNMSFWLPLFIYCVAMAVIFLSNLKNIQTRKNSIVFLSFAFLFGGIAGIFLTSSRAYIPLLLGHIFLLITWTLVALFLITLSQKEQH